ncbi:hypothetical protein ACFQ07_04735, partial [Actinomadura adrarensis]
MRGTDRDAGQARYDAGSGDGALREAEAVLDAPPEPKMTFRQAMSAGGGMTLGVFVGLQVLDSVDGAMFSV